MTDEEKQAIERFKNNASYCITSTETTKIILNLIEKQQTRIQDLEKALIDEDYKHRQEIEKIKKELESLKDFKDIAENKVTELNPIGLARANQLLSRQCHNLQEEIEKKEFEIKALQMEHDHDVKMIDEVKGEAVRLYKEIDKYKEMYATSIATRVNEAFKQEYKNNEDLEMLYKGCQIELEKKDKIIDLMAEWFEEWAEFIDEENYYTIFRKMSKEDIKEYFKKKVEDK